MIQFLEVFISILFEKLYLKNTYVEYDFKTAVK